MNRPSGEMICLGTYITGMLLLMISSPVWYLSPILTGGYLFLWYTSRGTKEFIPALFIGGEISCAAAWYTSPWLAWVIQIPVIGLFLLRLNIQDTRMERIAFITLCNVLALITLLTDMVNHTGIPIVIILGASLLILLFILVSEFRLRREYAGERL